MVHDSPGVEWLEGRVPYVHLLPPCKTDLEVKADAIRSCWLEQMANLGECIVLQ